jgi:hypothetical protein
MSLQFDKPPQQVLAQFKHLTKALIDASSIIYSHKAGFLNLLQAELELVATSEVITEAGPDATGIGIIHCHTKSMSVDDMLLYCAEHYSLPVISEDKKILAKLKRTDLPYFNVLMMLNYLCYVDAIDRRQYLKYHTALRVFAWYSPKIWAYGNSVHYAMEKPIKWFIAPYNNKVTSTFERRPNHE